MILNNFDSGFTNIMGDEKLRNDYLGDRYSRLEKGLADRKKPGILKKRLTIAFALVCLIIGLVIWLGVSLY